VTEEPYNICEGCRERIDPDAPDTVAAVEMTRIVTMGPTIEYVEGMGTLFHEGCYPEGSPRYRRKDVGA
jgi:hypothetical protein